MIVTFEHGVYLTAGEKTLDTRLEYPRTPPRGEGKFGGLASSFTRGGGVQYPYIHILHILGGGGSVVFMACQHLNNNLFVICIIICV